MRSDHSRLEAVVRDAALSTRIWMGRGHNPRPFSRHRATRNGCFEATQAWHRAASDPSRPTAGAEKPSEPLQGTVLHATNTTSRPV
jgi:hypothetical protein